MDSLFGLELSLPMKFFIAFAIVLILIGTAAYLLRRFGSGTLATVTQRNRQPRLAVVDATPIDNRRRLVIVRRDNVEHLLLIGGPTDVLVESNIVRAGAQAARDPIRPASVEPLTFPEDGNWPLVPASQPPRVEPIGRPEPVRAEPVRTEPAAPMRPAAVHIPTTQVPPPQPPAQPHAPHAAAPHPVPQPPMQQAPSQPGLLHPAPAQPMPAQHVSAPRIVPLPPAAATAPVFIHPLPPELPAAAPVPDFRAQPAPAAPRPPVAPAHVVASASPPQEQRAHAADAAVHIEPPASTVPAHPPEPEAVEEQNLATMAHRLEAALRRPSPAPAMPSAVPAPTSAAPAPMAAIRPRVTPVAPPGAIPRQQAPSYENLQREMANLLGRQSGGS